MRAAVLRGVRDVRIEDVPDPAIRRPTDALVRVVAAAVCGSDLRSYRGMTPFAGPRRTGHEFVGVVEDTGAEVRTVATGDFVIAPFVISDGTCPHCHNGVHTACVRGTYWGGRDEDGELVDGGQGEAVRVPLADGTLVPVLDGADQARVPHLLTLADVMPTGHHAAIAAGVGPGSTVAVVGDGAVGQCAIIAARQLGADRIVAMSRSRARQNLARQLGATDIIEERGDAGAERVVELLSGIGASCVLECVGTREAVLQAVKATRPGGRIGRVGLPAHDGLPSLTLFERNITLAGGLAPARAYIERLLPAVLDGSIEPGAVFDLMLSLSEVTAAYAAMDGRRAIKALLRPADKRTAHLNDSPQLADWRLSQD